MSLVYILSGSFQQKENTWKNWTTNWSQTLNWTERMEMNVDAASDWSLRGPYSVYVCVCSEWTEAAGSRDNPSLIPDNEESGPWAAARQPSESRSPRTLTPREPAAPRSLSLSLSPEKLLFVCACLHLRYNRHLTAPLRSYRQWDEIPANTLWCMKTTFKTPVRLQLEITLKRFHFQIHTVIIQNNQTGCAWCKILLIIWN